MTTSLNKLWRSTCNACINFLRILPCLRIYLSLLGTPLFDSKYYQELNPDVQISGINPLLHFIKHGWREGRNPCVYFDLSYYLQNNPDVAAAGSNPLLHFLETGWQENRNPNPYFDIQYYQQNCPGLRGNPLINFITTPLKELANPSPIFDVQYYLTTHPEVAISQENPLGHYLRLGKSIGYKPTADMNNSQGCYGSLEVLQQRREAYGTNYKYRQEAEVSLGKPLKILLVSHNLNYEGAPISLLELAQGLKAAGNIPVIFSMLDGPLRAQYLDSGIKVHVAEKLDIQNCRDMDEYSAQITVLSSLISAHNPDVVFANTVYSWWAIEASAQIDLPSIWCIRESHTPFSYFSGYHPLISHQAQRCLDYAYRVVFPAQSTLNVFKPMCLHDNFVVVHNGFDFTRLEAHINSLSREKIRAEYAIDSDEISVIFPATVCERKGQLDLIRAIDSFSDIQLSKVCFHIIGDRPNSSYSQILHQLIRSLSPAKAARIHVYNETKDVGKYYLSGDIFVCCSRIESYPKVIQEAMYFGLPIITTPVFGISEQVVDGESALFYCPGSIDQLQNNLQKLIASKQMRDTLGAAARARLENMSSHSHMINQYNALLQESVACHT